MNLKLTLNAAVRALQSAQHDLERQLATDNLRKGLAHRPEKDELIERMFFSSLPHVVADSIVPGHVLCCAAATVRI